MILVKKEYRFSNLRTKKSLNILGILFRNASLIKCIYEECVEKSVGCLFPQY